MKKQKKQTRPLTCHLCYGKDRVPLAGRVQRLIRFAACCLVLCFIAGTAFSQGMSPQTTYSDVSYKGTVTPCLHTMDAVGARFNADTFKSDNYGGAYEGEHYVCGIGASQISGCTANYLFTTYTNTNNVFWLDDLSGSSYRGYYVEVFVDTAFNSGLSLAWTSTAADAKLHYITLNSPKKCEWYLKYSKFNFDINDFEVVKTVRICVIPKIQQVAIEVPEFCSADGFTLPNGNLHFKIRTTPSIDSVMFHQDLVYNGFYTPSPGPGCNQVEAFQVRFDPQVVTYTGTGAQADVYPVRSVYSDNNGSPLLPPDNSAKASKWNLYPSTPPGIREDFYANINTPAGGNNFDLASYFDPNGPNAGKAVKIRVHITDGVLLDRYIDAPVIIHSPLVSTASAGYAGGFDTTRYTLPAGSAQVWSAASDPVFAQYGNTTTPATLRIRDSLVIPAGTSLTIQGRRLKLGPKGRIIVEAGKNGREGGFLKLDGATVTQYTNSCFLTNYMWSGIEVRGDRTKDQLPGVNGLGAQWQGAIDIENYSELSYAKVGIITWNPAGPYSSSGGVITARASHFLNNGVAVQVLPYTAPAYGPNNSIIDPYRASFTNCDFDITSALSTPFSAHLSGERVSGVSVRGCRFSNSYSGTGIGINGFDFNVRVDRSLTGLASYTPTRFTGLQQGMKMGAVIGTNGAFSVRNSEFTTSVNGVWSNGVQFPVITDNRFVMTGGNIIVQSVGTAVYTGAHYLITRNTYNAQKSGQTAGVAIRNAGSTAAPVVVNSYGDLFTGNLSNDLNNAGNPNIPKGLQFLCNDYKSNKFAEAARGSNPNQHGMNPSQGSSTKSAGNTFSANNKDIYNPANEVVPITYWYDNGVSKNPVNVVGSVNRQFTTGANSCDYSAGTGTQDPRDPIKGLRMAQHVGDAFSDSTGRMNTDSAYYWLDQMQTPYGDLTKTDLLLESGRTEEASNVYNSIATTYEMPEQEATEFKVWGRKLLNLRMALLAAGRQPNELSNAQVDTLNQVAEGATMWAQVRAQNWLSLYDGRDFERSFLFPEDSAAPQARKTNIASAINYSVYPNPVSEYLSVAYTNASDKGAVMQITDVVGRVISETNLEGRSGNLNIDVRNFQSGVYLYRILESGKTMQTGKVTKQ